MFGIDRKRLKHALKQADEDPELWLTGIDVLRFFGKAALVLGATVLIVLLVGALILLFDIHNARFEVAPMISYISLFAWGALFTGIGVLLLALAYYYDRTPPTRL